MWIAHTQSLSANKGLKPLKYVCQVVLWFPLSYLLWPSFGVNQKYNLLMDRHTDTGQ